MKVWLQLLRISNVPTVWSNVLVGVVAGGEAGAAWLTLAGDPALTLQAQLRHAWLLMLAMSCLYLAGMALNDVLDVAHDRFDAPHRPIVTGRLSRRAAAVAASVLFVLGFALVLPYRSAALMAASAGLVACIVLYDALHHRRPLSRHLMGVCRGMIIVAAGVSVADPRVGRWLLLVGVPALLLTVYTNVLTWFAAREADPAAGPARRRLVLGLLAAMPLLDAAWLLVLGYWPAACLCVACAALTRVWHRWVSGT